MSIEEQTAPPSLETPPETSAPPIDNAVATEKPKARPVEARERVASVDVIRGVALLGILAMNIVSFAWGDTVYGIPIMAPGAGPADTAVWAFNHVVFDTKMMTLFSMLFGAGLVLMSERGEARGAKVGWIFYRRTFWLLVIGLCHAIFIWDGDILVLYALCGFLLYPFRKLKPKTLILTGLIFNLLLVPLLLGFRLGGIPYMRRTFDRVEAQIERKEKPGWWDEKVHDAWKNMSKNEKPTWEDKLKDIPKYRGPYGALVEERATSMILAPIGFLLGGWWLAGGRMLIGMGFMKAGVFAAQRSAETYRKMMLVGYGIGIPLMLFDVWHEVANEFFLGRRLWYTLDGWPFLTFYGSLFVVLGHIGLVMWLYQRGAFPNLTRRLAAVGRMALTNYLLTSIFCTTLFYGYGGDFFASIHRPLLYAIVLAIWTFYLLVSPLWLSAFRYGPFEWLWRSLTYWKLQPMRRDPAAA